MRSWTRTSAAVAALALAGCGNYSTEDLRFLAALPQRDDLVFKVPAAGQPGALTACSTRESSVWGWAKPTSDGINSGVDLLLSLVDLVRRQPPTWRADDARRWGPFDDRDHPGIEIQVIIARAWPPELGGAPRYAYAFQARAKGTPDFTTIIGGAFDGGSASHGRGGIVMYFEQMIALGMGDASTPAGTMQVAYDRASDPVTIQLSLSNDGFGVVQFGYRYAGYAAGGGVFDYAFKDQAGNVFVVSTGYDAVGAGRASVGFEAAGGGTGGFRECWGAGGCLVYVLDPGNYSCAPADWPCSLGVETDCPAVPASPF